MSFSVGTLTNGSTFSVVMKNVQNQNNLDPTCCGDVTVSVADSGGNAVATNAAVASIPPTTTLGAATGSLSNNGFTSASTPANYTFTLNLVNTIPANGQIIITNAPGLGFTSADCTCSVASTCTADVSGDLTVTLTNGILS